jgi:uncharacterized protein YbjT (DUF2867 family)
MATPKQWQDKVIVVTGATGRQGGAVARHLLAANKFPVRALTRNADSPAARRQWLLFEGWYQRGKALRKAA